MPVTEDGIRTEMCLNPLGVINRMNMSQLYEHELNFISDHVVTLMKTADSDVDSIEMMLDYIELVNPVQAQSMYQFIEANMSDAFIKEFLDEIYKDGIMLHQPPFWDNVSFDVMRELYRRYELTPKKFVGIEKPLIIADIYYIKLKHEAAGKMSARSCGSINLKGVMVRFLYSNIH